MSDFNLGNLISKYVNYSAVTARMNIRSAPQSSLPNSVEAETLSQTNQSENVISASKTLQMGTLTGGDNSVYIKDLMKLPKNLNELFYMLQKNLTLAQFNQQFSSAFAKGSLTSTQAQILAQLESLSTTEVQSMLNKMTANTLSQLQSSFKNLPLSSEMFINLDEISALIQSNGKNAVTNLITAMAGAAKSGITDLSQMRDAARLINASIAAASQNDNAQTMKLLMLLYLPWLPLQEGVGFDLSIESSSNNEDADSILTITITTVNYGTVVATLVLENSNSVLVNIECLKDFPKDELLLRISSDEKHYSMQSSITFETSDKENSNQVDKQKAKINMSDTNKINPYLLLMAHAIIRHTLEIDKNKSDGMVSTVD